ncbi:MAG: hypothetical protein MZV63_66495 [Marinilabiliales bacterium]|nr:hypothetical protein [Marinilabiliales bacterium]
MGRDAASDNRSALFFNPVINRGDLCSQLRRRERLERPPLPADLSEDLPSLGD